MVLKDKYKIVKRLSSIYIALFSETWTQFSDRLVRNLPVRVHSGAVPAGQKGHESSFFNFFIELLWNKAYSYMLMTFESLEFSGLAVRL